MKTKPGKLLDTLGPRVRQIKPETASFPATLTIIRLTAPVPFESLLASELVQAVLVLSLERWDLFKATFADKLVHVLLISSPELFQLFHLSSTSFLVHF
jgi:hypothetical protein